MESMDLVPTGEYYFSCCHVFSTSSPLMSLSGISSTQDLDPQKNVFFLQALHLNHPPHKMIITPHYSTYHFSLNQHKHIIMADQLPLAKLSIQNKIHQHDETTQPIKTKKIHPLNPPRLRHPCSLDTLPSPTNKWSAMTHPLRATVMGFNGMTISYGHYYFYQDRVLLTHAYTEQNNLEN